MEKPMIHLHDKELTPPKNPTMKMWRMIVKLDEDAAKQDSPMVMIDKYLEVLAIVFGVEKEDLEDLDISEVLPAYRDAGKWISELVYSGLKKLPEGEEKNAHTAKA